MKKIITLLFAAAIFASCAKEKNTAPANQTALKITVTTASGTPVANAIVTLYSSSTDWENLVNALDSRVTGADGTATFTALQAKKYYWFARNDCFTNGFNTVSSAGPITINVTNTASTKIEQTGQLVFNNKSANPYQVYINGVSSFEVPGNTIKTLKYKPAGFYTLRVLQLSGYVITPTDLTYTGTLACGGSLTTMFP